MCVTLYLTRFKFRLFFLIFLYFCCCNIASFFLLSRLVDRLLYLYRVEGRLDKNNIKKTSTLNSTHCIHFIGSTNECCFSERLFVLIFQFFFFCPWTPRPSCEYSKRQPAIYNMYCTLSLSLSLLCSLSLFIHHKNTSLTTRSNQSHTH